MTGSFAGGPLAAVIASKREDHARATLDRLGLTLLVYSSPDEAGNLLGVVAKDGSTPERRFAGVEDLDQFITETVQERLFANPADQLDAARYAVDTAKQLLRPGTCNAPGTPRPYIAQAVHYVSYGTPGGEYRSECRAATVTSVPTAGYRGTISLCALNPTGLFFNPDVTHDPGSVKDAALRKLRSGELLECAGRIYRGGTWHFIPEASS